MIIRERFQLPTKEDIFGGITGATLFSKLDASQAFWQVSLDKDSTHLTTFNTPYGRYQYTQLPYGLCSAPEVFHRTMEQMFENIEGVRVYMDDILVWGANHKEHKERLDQVKARIIKYGLIMNWAKCELERKEVVFIGEKLNKKGLSPSDERIEAIANMERPLDSLMSTSHTDKYCPN